MADSGLNEELDNQARLADLNQRQKMKIVRKITRQTDIDVKTEKLSRRIEELRGKPGQEAPQQEAQRIQDQAQDLQRPQQRMPENQDREEGNRDKKDKDDDEEDQDEEPEDEENPEEENELGENAGEGAEGAEALEGAEAAEGAGLAGAGGAAAGVEAAEGAAVVAEGAAVVASSGVWIPALAVLLVVLVFGALIGIAVITPVAICNSNYTDGVGTAVGKAGLTASGICTQLNINANTATQAAPTVGQAQPVGGDTASRGMLQQYGITVNKLDCASTTQTDCTSLDNTKSVVIAEVIKFAQACDISLGGDGTQNKCGIIVTGGSEAGHADSKTTPPCSHSNGDKIDVSASQALTTYIQKNFKSEAGRGGTNGGARYSDPAITSSFVIESSTPTQGAHWDISIGCIN